MLRALALLLLATPTWAAELHVSPGTGTLAEAIAGAQPGDVLLIAGKGHETYQVLADRTIHFDDREVVRELAEGTK